MKSIIIIKNYITKENFIAQITDFQRKYLANNYAQGIYALDDL